MRRAAGGHARARRGRVRLVRQRQHLDEGQGGLDRCGDAAGPGRHEGRLRHAGESGRRRRQGSPHHHWHRAHGGVADQRHGRAAQRHAGRLHLRRSRRHGAALRPAGQADQLPLQLRQLHRRHVQAERARHHRRGPRPGDRQRGGLDPAARDGPRARGPARHPGARQGRGQRRQHRDGPAQLGRPGGRRHRALGRAALRLPPAGPLPAHRQRLLGRALARPAAGQPDGLPGLRLRPEGVRGPRADHSARAPRPLPA